MKATLSFIYFLLLTTVVIAQSPQKMSFQAVIRDSNNDLLSSAPVGIQISILQGSSAGSSVYSETHSTTTNANGLVTIEVGDGSTSQNFGSIDWSAGPYFIKIETDPQGGSNYSIEGISELLSVPYALHTLSSDSALFSETSTSAAQASFADSATVAGTAQAALHATLADTATYASAAATASHAITSDSASFVDSALIAGMAVSAMHATLADTATYASAAATASHASTSDSALFTDSAVIAGTAVSTMHATLADTATYASAAATASHAITSDSASFVDSAAYALNASSADSASFAGLAASAIHATNADSASHSTTANSALTATYSDTASHASTADSIIGGIAELDPRVPHGTTVGQMQYWDGSDWVTVPTGQEGHVLTMVGGAPTWMKLGGAVTLDSHEVYNPATAKVWMDRNLGASQIATNTTDTNAYGDLYQWGRPADGHEYRYSGTTSTLSSSDSPGHADFITIGSGNYDWRNPQNNALWQGVNGINNPCPSGYRLPTSAELVAEKQSWSSNNAAGAFASPLKLTLAGSRHPDVGAFNGVGTFGLYWSSTVSGTYAQAMFFTTSNSTVPSGNYRAIGGSVRCIKD